ncbi:unnamed protein product [Arabidopsis lyrata]|uniref:Predicted protein n=1 Tax=Arabidopsis lyrata subsp. lyrata TaxID=81972 RepID=D7KPH7_ARALL|nr:paired amphipathic helix protein Sin3-like 3 [Arabidopsis lyrata subsp. lyrata]EFH66870.1 predicted protein [Arabidopsis lyrata subsp. lyrata]CAH8253406.1 unnamed protein product [Arabidopsis lyrata]|eukprot:XP_002890611.1 paired amphipathic helix protein Sin3-like 3 [Arabidopsis lyrata subsp. lyrata]
MSGGEEDVQNLTTRLHKLQTTSEGGGGDTKNTKVDDACRFLFNVKERFKDDTNDVFSSFIDNLLKLKSGSKSMNEVCHETTIQFREHPDLLLEFAPFLAGFSQERPSS